MIFYNFNVVCKKNNQTSISDVDREISTLGSTDNAGNSVNLISGIIRLPIGSGFLYLHQRASDDRFYLSHTIIGKRRGSQLPVLST